MSWVLLALGAALLWTAVNIIDKHVLSHELHDPILATVCSSTALFCLFTIVSLFHGSIALPATTRGIAVFAGICYSIAILLYYEAISKEEVSRAMPVFGLIPIFVAILAFFLLGETFTTLTYLGIGLIVIGAILVSLRKLDFHFKTAFFMAVVSSLFFAFRNVSTKVATLHNSIWAILFWIGIGGGFVTILLLVAHHPHIRKRAKLGIKYLIIVGILMAVAFFAFTFAITTGPVSLVSALIQTQPVFVFFAATLLSRYWPGFIYEKISKDILLQKSLAIIMIVIGALLIV